MDSFVVKDSENLVRHVFSPFHVKKDRSVKWQAFNPNPKNGETSVTCKDSLTAKQLYSIGKNIETSHKGKAFLCGEAKILAETVRRNRLDVIGAPNENNPNHANIVNWPIDKDACIMVCKELILYAQYKKY